ncbi:TonB-dependent receptor [Chitinophaga niabensis]|uniref:TonB-dependent receptor n=1 Tax=Chitinophaga niabensis TaxID=536979 RepID=UPI00116125B6|nr:TonB-dependent receptor [Chitinophaga niabensis]
MKRNIIVVQVLALLLLCMGVSAQTGGRVTGKVTDKRTGEALIGVTVLVQGTSLGGVTDVEGRYTINLTPGTYTLLYKLMSYQTKSIADVVVKNGAAANQDVVLDEPKSQDLKEFVVQGSARTETLNALLTLQKNTNTVAQVVSAESIKKSPDRNTSEVLKRVSGASMQDGKFLVVRGLADRYNQATINGALLPSTEPDRKTFAFDIFPSSIIDNIVINKAATPEMPGEFAGGLVQINTKDVPDDNFVNFTIGSGFNTKTIGKDFHTYKGGGLDIFGLDDGTRKLNTAFPSTADLRSYTAAARAEFGQYLNDTWSANSKNAPMNTNFQVSAGFRGKQSSSKGFGGVFSISYNKQNRLIDINRNLYELDGSPRFEYNDLVSTQNTLLGGIANLTYRIGKSKFSWKNSYSINSNDQTTLRNGADIDADARNLIRSQELAFTSNRLYNSQLIGDHFLRAGNYRIRWNANVALLNQDVPDLRRLKYSSVNGSEFFANIPANTGSPRNAGRFYSNLDENTFGGSADIAKTFKMGGNQQQIKVGGLFQRKDRIFRARALAIIRGSAADNLVFLSPDKILAKENYGADKFYLDDLTSNSDSYNAYSNLGAGFLQFDNQIGEKIRLVWGARVEYFLQNLQSPNLPIVENSSTDVLPSLNFTYLLNSKTNIRVSASQTVARPEFREISPFSFYDFERNGLVFGRTDLTRSKITNVDARYEIYPKAGEVLTLGVFYKYFDTPIETNYETQQGAPFFSYQNAKSATSLGIELDFRKNLGFIKSGFLERLTVFSNAALIKSEVKFPAGFVGTRNRPMQGQSPYVVNAGIQFDAPEAGTNASVLFNVIGKRIAQVGNADFPDVWENPRPLLDFQITQRIFKNADLKLTASDILSSKGIYYWERNGDKKYDASKDLVINKFNFGTNLGVSFSYKF